MIIILLDYTLYTFISDKQSIHKLYFELLEIGLKFAPKTNLIRLIRLFDDNLFDKRAQNIEKFEATFR